MKKHLISAIALTMGLTTAVFAENTPTLNWAHTYQGLTSAGNSPISWIKLSDGNYLYSDEWGSKTSDLNFYFDNVETDKTGGGYEGTSYCANLLLQKYNADGDTIWSVHSNYGYIYSNNTTVVASPEGGFVVVAMARGVVSDPNYTTSKLMDFVQADGSIYSATCADDAPLVSGNNFSDDRILVVKFSNEGMVEWHSIIYGEVKTIDTRTTATNHYPYSADVDDDGNIYICGNFRTKLYIPNANGTVTTLTCTNTDSWNGDSQNVVGEMYLLKLNNQGKYVASLQGVGDPTFSCLDNVKYYKGNIYLNGRATSSNTLTLDNNTINADATYQTMFLTSINADNLSVNYVNTLTSVKNSASRFVIQNKNAQALNGKIYFTGCLNGGLQRAGEDTEFMKSNATMLKGYVLKMDAATGAVDGGFCYSASSTISCFYGVYVNVGTLVATGYNLVPTSGHILVTIDQNNWELSDVTSVCNNFGSAAMIAKPCQDGENFFIANRGKGSAATLLDANSTLPFNTTNNAWGVVSMNYTMPLAAEYEKPDFAWAHTYQGLTAAGNSPIATAKFNDGNYLFAAEWGSGTKSGVTNSNLYIDAENTGFEGGQYTGNSYCANLLLQKLNSDNGNIVWNVFTNYGYTSSTNVTTTADGGFLLVTDCKAVVSDPTYSATKLMGIVQSDGTNYDVNVSEPLTADANFTENRTAIVKFNTNGKVEWNVVLDDAAWNSADADAAGNIYLAGSKLLKLNANGSIAGSLTFSGDASTAKIDNVVYENGTLYINGRVKKASDDVTLGTSAIDASATYETLFLASIDAETFETNYLKTFTSVANGAAKPAFVIQNKNAQYLNGIVYFTGSLNGGLQQDGNTVVSNGTKTQLKGYIMAMDAETGNVRASCYSGSAGISNFFGVYSEADHLIISGYDMSTGALLVYANKSDLSFYNSDVVCNSFGSVASLAKPLQDGNSFLIANRGKGTTPSVLGATEPVTLSSATAWGIVANKYNIISASAAETPENYEVAVLADAEKGSVSGSGYYAVGSSQTIAATPAAGYVFSTWSDGNTNAERTINVNTDLCYTAIFAPVDYNIVLAECSNGTISANTTTANIGDTIVISSTASAGYELKQYFVDGDAITSNTFVMPASDVTISATFKLSNANINTAICENGSVSVDKEVAQMGDTITLSNSVNTGYQFVKYNVYNSGNSAESVAVSDARFVMPAFPVTVSAEFEIMTFELTLSLNNAEFGSVSGTDVYAYGSEVKISATAAEHYHFISWNDGETTAERTVKVLSDSLFTATFAIDSFNLTLASNNAEFGSVSGAGVYAYGAQAEISASAAVGYQFAQWSDGSADSVRTITVASDSTFTAEFVAVEIPQDTISVVPDTLPVVPDTLPVVPDTLPVVPDTLPTIALDEPANELAVYPNPASEYIYVQTTAENSTISIFDITGRIAMIVENCNDVIMVNINQLRNGMYIVSESSNGKVLSVKRFNKR